MLLDMLDGRGIRADQARLEVNFATTHGELHVSGGWIHVHLGARSQE